MNPTTPSEADGELREKLMHVFSQHRLVERGRTVSPSDMDAFVGLFHQELAGRKQKQKIDLGMSVIAKIDELRIAPVVGRPNPDAYWQGFSDLADALCAFIGAGMAELSHKEGEDKNV